MLCGKVTDELLFSGCADDLTRFDGMIRKRFKVGNTILEVPTAVQSIDEELQRSEILRQQGELKPGTCLRSIKEIIQEEVSIDITFNDEGLKAAICTAFAALDGSSPSSDEANERRH